MSLTMGNRIKAVREDRGYTQVSLAKAIGVSVRSMQLYEYDKNEPTIEVMKKISSVLDVDILYLIYDEEPPEPKPFVLEKRIRDGKFDARLLAKFYKCSRKWQDIILDLLDEFSKKAGD
jgi:transcriptional regulator with XRE-family HTH domain